MKSEVTNTKYPANILPRLIPGQARSVRKLTRQCCNNDNGNCLLLDDGDPCVCPQAISYTLICKHFRRGVLPLERNWRTRSSVPKEHAAARSAGAFLSGRFRTRQILCEMCRRGTPKAEGRTRPKKEVGRRQLTPRKPFVYKAFQKPLFKSVYVFT